MPSPKNYTVGWICAIRTEYVAAQAFLDKSTKDQKTTTMIIHQVKLQDITLLLQSCQMENIAPLLQQVFQQICYIDGLLRDLLNGSHFYPQFLKNTRINIQLNRFEQRYTTNSLVLLCDNISNQC